MGRCLFCPLSQHRPSSQIGQPDKVTSQVWPKVMQSEKYERAFTRNTGELSPLVQMTSLTGAIRWSAQENWKTGSLAGSLGVAPPICPPDTPKYHQSDQVPRDTGHLEQEQKRTFSFTKKTPPPQYRLFSKVKLVNNKCGREDRSATLAGYRGSW